MPEIPIYKAKERLPTPGPVQMPLNLYALPYLEMEKAGMEIAQMGQDIKEAHRAGIYSQNIAESASKLQDLGLEFEQDPDIWTIEERAKKAVESFKQERLKEIKDPIVAKNFAFAFDKMAMTKMATIIRRVRTRQADFNKAQTFGSLDALERIYGKASTEAEGALILSQMKGIIMGQAQAGVLSYGEAQKEWKQRVSRMSGTEVREDIWEDPRQAHENLVAGKYEGLEDKDRIKYIEMAERRIEAEDRDDLRLIKEQERQEARELKEKREETGLTMLQMMADGTLTRNWLDKQIVKRYLDEGSFAAGLRWLEDGGGNVDDHATVNRLTDRILAGEDMGEEISQAFSGGQLRFDTQLGLKKANASRQRQEEETEENRALRWLFEKLAIPTGELAPLKADESARKADARRLYYIRRDQNIDPWTAASEVLDRIKPIIAIPLMRLPTPPWGGGRIKNSADLMEATTWLWEQYRTGMPKAEVTYWLDILNKYQEIDEKFGIEELLKGLEEREQTREKTIQKGMEERGMKRKGTRELR